MSAKIPVRGGDRGWAYEGAGVCGEGKQGHMASAVEEIVSNYHNVRNNIANTPTEVARLSGNSSSYSVESAIASPIPQAQSQEPLLITRSSTLLIDDDASNIKVALREGVRALWLNPKGEVEGGWKALEDIIKLGGAGAGGDEDI